MSNHTRRQNLGLGKTAAGGSGGSFASHERSSAAPPPVSSISDTDELNEIIRQRTERLEAIAQKRAELEREEAAEQLDLLSAKVDQVLHSDWERPPSDTHRVEFQQSDDNYGQLRFGRILRTDGETLELTNAQHESLTDFVDSLGIQAGTELVDDPEFIGDREYPKMTLVDSSLPTPEPSAYSVGAITQHPKTEVKKQSLNIPSRQVDLELGDTPEWPDGWSMQSVSFGEDESGRFYTSWGLRDQDGEERDYIYTEFEDGADFGSEDPLPWEDPEAVDAISGSVRKAHILMNSNSYVVGLGACEQDSELEAQVRRISLGESGEPGQIR